VSSEGGGCRARPGTAHGNGCRVRGAGNATPVKFRVAVLLAGWCQLRRGEVLGLQRRDIDINAGVVAIERTWVQSPGGQHIIGPPKTDAGRRSIAIPSHILPAINEHLRSIGSRPDAWLFPGEEEGYPISTRTLSHVWSKARKSIGRTDLRFHDLRHSGLTWAAATGASLAELMRRAGHVSPVAALRYQHATDDRDRALADSLAALASTAPMAALSVVPEPVTDEIRTKLPESDQDKATITPLTSTNGEQSQRGSNPCLHLERANMQVQAIYSCVVLPGEKGHPVQFVCRAWLSAAEWMDKRWTLWF
jgi:hypothetical protein